MLAINNDLTLAINQRHLHCFVTNGNGNIFNCDFFVFFVESKREFSKNIFIKKHFILVGLSGDKVEPSDHCKAVVSNVQFPRIYKSPPPVTNNSLFL